MALHHINQRGEVEQCREIISCKFGDFDTEHYDSADEARAHTVSSDLNFSLNMYRRLNATVEALDSMANEPISAANLGLSDSVQEIRGSVASLAFKLGVLSTKPTLEMIEDAVQVRIKMVDQLEALIRRYSFTAPVEAKLVTGLNDLLVLTHELSAMRSAHSH